MTIQSIKTYLYTKAASAATSIKQATPQIIDQMCMDAMGKSYLYALRPMAIGLHGYFRTQENGPNIAYNALALTGGSFVRSLPPVNYAMNVAYACTGRIASFALKMIRSIPLPTPIAQVVDGIGKDTAALITDAVQEYDPNARLPQGKFMRYLVPFIAGGYLNFRITQFITRILPYKIASHFTEIKAKPRSPNKSETLFWLVGALFIAFTTLLPRIQRRKEIKEIGLFVQRLEKLEADVKGLHSKMPQYKALELKRRLTALEGELKRLLPVIPPGKAREALKLRLKNLKGKLVAPPPKSFWSRQASATKTARPKKYS
jgi:hypothetical protein